MMIDVDKLKEFVSKNWFMKSELGSIQVIDVKKIIDFINANQVECEVIKTKSVCIKYPHEIMTDKILHGHYDNIDKIIIVKKQVVSHDKEGE